MRPEEVLELISIYVQMTLKYIFHNSRAVIGQTTLFLQQTTTTTTLSNI